MRLDCVGKRVSPRSKLLTKKIDMICSPCYTKRLNHVLCDIQTIPLTTKQHDLLWDLYTAHVDRAYVELVELVPASPILDDHSIRSNNLWTRYESISTGRCHIHMCSTFHEDMRAPIFVGTCWNQQSTEPAEASLYITTILGRLDRQYEPLLVGNLVSSNHFIFGICRYFIRAITS